MWDDLDDDRGSWTHLAPFCVLFAVRFTLPLDSWCQLRLPHEGDFSYGGWVETDSVHEFVLGVKIGVPIDDFKAGHPSNPSSRMITAFTDHSRLLTHVQPGFKNQPPKFLTTILGRGRDRALVISIFEQALAHRLLWLQMGEHWDLPLREKGGDGALGLDESCHTLRHPQHPTEG